MTPRWPDVRCASIPVEDLSALADLRSEEGIRVTIARGRAWVCWDDGPGGEATRRILVACLLPLAGVEVFARRDGHWYRPGDHLPAFHVPVGDGSVGTPLDRVILPEPLTMLWPGGDAPRPVALRLVHDESERARPPTAVRCCLRDLAEWADWAPSDWIESLSGAWCAAPGLGLDDAEVLIIDRADPAARTEVRPPGRNRLPALADALRFWGNDVLIPLGYRAEPPLAERALRTAIGAGPDDVVLLDGEGPELIPRQAFRALSRAGIRLARKVEASATSAGGGPP
jgi:MoxR-vWA-beta-propeller ternary system domain bpX2